MTIRRLSASSGALVMTPNFSILATSSLRLPAWMPRSFCSSHWVSAPRSLRSAMICLRLAFPPMRREMMLEQRKNRA